MYIEVLEYISDNRSHLMTQQKVLCKIEIFDSNNLYYVSTELYDTQWSIY